MSAQPSELTSSDTNDSVAARLRGFGPLGLTLLGPIIVNIVLFHIFLAPDGLVLAGVVSVLALFLLWIYRFKFPAIFRVSEPL